ncbi:MAG: hypothetical protein HC882_00860 [Acidobacteria bacterium]|nr:hypothetical protein [Acidobacteriota bacterium]
MAGRNNVSKAGHTQNDPKIDICTPEWFVDMVREVIGEIDLDPASNPKSKVGAKWTIIPPHHLPDLTDEEALALGIILGDGLLFPWDGLSFYVNPPYSRTANRPWSKKIHEEGIKRIGNGGPGGIALVPSSPGAKWFQQTYAHAAAVCFMEGRLTFDGVPPNPKTGKVDPADFESATIYYGDDVERFRKVFGKRGWIP